MSSGIVTNSQSLTTDELHYLTHPTFFLGAFKSEPLLVLDSGTASVRSVVSSKYSLHDFNYDLFGENAITPDHFPSAYEFNFARNARFGDEQSSVLYLRSLYDALQPHLRYRGRGRGNYSSRRTATN